MSSVFGSPNFLFKNYHFLPIFPFRFFSFNLSKIASIFSLSVSKDSYSSVEIYFYDYFIIYLFTFPSDFGEADENQFFGVLRKFSIKNIIKKIKLES